MPLYIAAILIMIVVDQVVKHWAFTVLQPQHTIPLIENVFHLTYIENRGAAFSMFAKFDFCCTRIGYYACNLLHTFKKADADSTGQLVPCADCGGRGRQCH